MRLLLDENLSPTLVFSLANVFPGTIHVRDLDLQSAPDSIVWELAASRDYTIVTKDSDFHQRSFVYGHPPKVIWIRLGNCSTRKIAELLIRKSQTIEAFHLSLASLRSWC